MRNGLEFSRPTWHYATAVALLTFAATIMLSGAIGPALGIATLSAVATAVLVWARQPGAHGTEEEPDVDGAWEAVAAELRRSRRHGRAFALLAVRAGADAARLMQPLLRTSDLAWVDGEMTYVLLSECDADQARGFISRARSALPDVLLAGKTAVAVFPTDGITLGGLLEALQAGGGAVPERSVHTRQLT